MYLGDVVTLLPIWLCVTAAETRASGLIFRVRREAVPKGLARSGRKVAEPLQFMPMMACVLRGRLRFCAVFLTPPAPPNALQRTLLA